MTLKLESVQVSIKDKYDEQIMLTRIDSDKGSYVSVHLIGSNKRVAIPLIELAQAMALLLPEYGLARESE